MHWVDLVIVAILLLSGLISIWRGFVREALSLATWIAAVVVGLTLSRGLASLLESYISVPSLRMAVAFGILFTATLIVGAVAGRMAVTFVQVVGLKGADRALGMVFGLARGVVIVAVLVLLASLTPMPQDPWWRESFLLDGFEQLAVVMRGFLPDDIAAYFVL